MQMVNVMTVAKDRSMMCVNTAPIARIVGSEKKNNYIISLLHIKT